VKAHAWSVTAEDKSVLLGALLKSNSSLLEISDFLPKQFAPKSQKIWIVFGFPKMYTNTNFLGN